MKKSIFAFGFVYLIISLSAINNCLDFEGSNVYVECGNDSTLTEFTEFTMEAWVWLENSNNNQKILGKFKDWNDYYIMGVGSGVYYSQIEVNDHLYEFAVGAVPSQQWTHLAVTFSKGNGGDNGTFYAYVNGELVYSATDVSDNAISVNSATFPFRIGVAPWDVSSYLVDGEIDEVRIWNTARTQTELRKNMYNELTGSELNLAAYYNFNQSNGDTLPDESNNSNDGTLTNMTGSEWQNSNAPIPFATYQNGNWTNSSTWLAGQGAPVKAWSKVKIDHNISLDADREVIDCEIVTDNIFVINNGITLTVSGEIINTGMQNGDGLVKLSGGTSSCQLAGTFGNIELDNVDGAELTDDLTANGTITLTNGSFTIGANTLTLNGSVSRTLGYFMGGTSSSIVFGGNGSSTNRPAISLENLTINRANGIGMSGDVEVNGTINLSDGTFTIGANTLSYKNEIVGTETNLSADNTSSITISGSAAGIIIPSNITHLNNVNLENANGISLQNSIEIDGTISLINGDIDLNGYTITLGQNAVLNESDGNTVKGISGTMITTRTFNAGDFSAGVNIAGMGAEITTTAALGSTTIERVHQAQEDGILRYFNISPTNNSSLNAELIFHYDDSELNGNIENELNLMKSSDTGNTWTSEGGIVDIENETIALSNIDSFSRWTAKSIKFVDSGISLTGVAASSADWGDYDNDGDLDLLLTGETESGIVSKIYRNDGNNDFTDTGIPLTGVSNGSAAWGDYDNDGNLDILLTGIPNVNSDAISKIYKNNGNNTFTEQNGISLTGVLCSSVAWGDYDNDGDLDILLTGTPHGYSDAISKIYKNNGPDGSGFTEQTGISLIGVCNSSVAWGDYDNDGDLDILLTGYSGSEFISKIYRNNDDHGFSDAGISLPGVNASSVAWGDYDNDGDLDILLTGFIPSEYSSNIYRNNGDNTFTEQSSISLIGVGTSAVAWGDYDNDGDLDILLTGFSASGYTSKIYRNNGDNGFTDIGIPLTDVGYSSVAWGDYDNDGDLDILLTGFTGAVYISKIYTNYSLSSNTQPNVPVNLSSVISENVELNWNAATDNETPSSGLSYNVRVGTSSGACDVWSGMVDISDGYRRIPALGNTNMNTEWHFSYLPNDTYYWSVQAIDNCFTGSAFSVEGSFTVDWISISTTNVTNITQTTASCGGNVTDEGASSVIAKGVVWNISENPTLESNIGITNDGSGLGSFTSSLTGLTSGQTYYVRAYATNLQETRYGEQMIFAPNMIPPGNTLDFDGSDDHVKIDTRLASTLSEETALTIEFWFKGSQLQSSVRMQNADGYVVTGWGASNPQHIISTDGGTTGISVGTESIIEDGNWHHLSLVWQKNVADSGFRSYLDGELVDQRTSADANLPAFSNDYTYLGSYYGSSEFMTGQLDEVRIWNTARTQMEIQSNMFNTLNGNENDLVAYYRFDHLSGTTLSDLTANSFYGTLVNMTNEDWVTSTVPVGDNGVIVQTQAQTNIGPAGMQMQVTLTNGGDETNYLGIYQAGSGDELITSGEVFPDGVNQRSNILWGLQEFGSVTANLIFDYSNINGLVDPFDVILLKRTDTASAWMNVTGLFEHNTTNKTFSGTGFTEFSEYSVSDNGDDPLPVTLSSFTGNLENGLPILNWTTQSETENLGWNIYRSEDENGLEDNLIKLNAELIPGMGTISVPTEYFHIDEIPTQQMGMHYYWLESVSYSGELEIHGPVSINLSNSNLLPDTPAKSFVNHNYPNPFNPITTIEFGIKEGETGTLTIYNILGQKVHSHKFESGFHTFNWDASKQASGVYFYQLRTDKFYKTNKMLMLK